MSQSPLVGLQQIADAAKVSRTTVSLALRDHPKISEPTRKKIHVLARKLGYRPNPLVAAHMSHLRALDPHYTGQCIAFVANASLREIEADTKTPMRRYYRGAQERARKLGYELELFNLSDPGMTSARLSQILQARGIRGLIIAPLSEGPAVSNVMLSWEHFALAMISHTFVRPRLHKVCNDEFSTIGRMIQQLLDYGFERIGIAMEARMDDHANHFWLAGYQVYQALNQPRHRLPHFITDDWRKEKFLAWFRKWKPEVIVTINADIVGWLREAGVRVPQDVSCASLYWKEDRAELTGFYQNHELMAAGAVDLVVAQLNRNERGLPDGEKTMLVQAVWKHGTTVRPKSGTEAERSLQVWTR